MQNGWTERIEELEAEVAKLTAERDADRRREYGYSQQTVDALTVERDKLEEENTKLRAFWEWSRLADKMTFEQYHWIGKEASRNDG